jgi:hypothetical protein
MRRQPVINGTLAAILPDKMWQGIRHDNRKNQICQPYF